MLLLALLAAPRAEVPLPIYPECGEPDRPDLCPIELDGRWSFLSYVPSHWNVSLAAQEEVGMGPGMWIDRAFRTSTGRMDVTIAVLDSGVEWDNVALQKKWRLNGEELPLPEGASSPDANGDGVVTLADWEGDSRVDLAAGDDVADALLDPSDLIATFSDGIDSDGNGYVDDVCGWDFEWNDNNPYDDVRYGHGTGMSEDAAAEGGDGGDIGACPNCTVLPIRVADSFVADGSAFGSGLVYAIDRDAAVALVAVGAVSQTSLVERAVDLAWESGLLVIGSAADETAYHPNPPGMAARTFYVHAIRYDTEEREEATSFLAYSNCTNHGVRLDGSASSVTCSSGATGMTSGITGLIVSAARDAGWEPTPAELHALLGTTADDIALPDDPSRYPTKPGWDAWSGWGRLNAAAAVEAAASQSVPPTAEITSPDWFEHVTAVGGPSLTVSGSVGSRFAEVSGWSLKVGVGLEPTEWGEVASGTGSVSGELATFTPPIPNPQISDHPLGATPVSRELTANAMTVQLRLTATDTAGRSTTARMSFYVNDDPDLMSGFPMRLGASLESSPALADIDGDGQLEIIQATGDGLVHALHADGSEVEGWPVHTEYLEEVDPEAPQNHRGSAAWTALGADVYAPVVASPAIGDLDGDGTLEVVVASFRGKLHVFGADGSPRAGFPVGHTAFPVTVEHDSLSESFFSSPALGDVDGDGALEIIVGGGDQNLHAWKADGSYASGFPVRLAWPDEVLAARRIVSSPAIGDLNGDGREDIVIGTNETLDDDIAVVYAVSGDGSLLPGWPQRQWGLFVDVLPMVGQGVPNSAALVDLVGDATPEIVLHGLAGEVQLLDASGEELWYAKSGALSYGANSNVSDSSIFPLINSPSIGDLDGDGVPDVVNGAVGFDYAQGQENDGERWDFDHALGAWSGVDGTFLNGFPRQMEDLQFFQNPAVVDLDGDRRMEAINASGGFLVHAWNSDGEEPPGWPKLTGQWMIAAPAVGDLDGDGTLEVVVATRGGWLFVWHTDGPADGPAGWVTFGHDNRRTHNYEVELPGFNAPYAEPEPESDCGCGHGGGLGGAGVGLAALALLRRRTNRP